MNFERACRVAGILQCVALFALPGGITAQAAPPFSCEAKDANNPALRSQWKKDAFLDAEWVQSPAIAVRNAEAYRPLGTNAYQRISLHLSYIPGAGGGTYHLDVMYDSNQWMFLEEGTSLMFLVDGERITLRTLETPERDVDGSGGVDEIATYSIDAATILRLATAKDVRGRLVGGRQPAVDFRFGLPDETSNVASCTFRRFYEDVATRRQ